MPRLDWLSLMSYMIQYMTQNHNTIRTKSLVIRHASIADTQSIKNFCGARTCRDSTLQGW